MNFCSQQTSLSDNTVPIIKFYLTIFTYKREKIFLHASVKSPVNFERPDENTIIFFRWEHGERTRRVFFSFGQSVCTSMLYKNIRLLLCPCAQAVISPACPKVGTRRSLCQLNSNQQTKMEWDIELHPISSPVLKPAVASHKLAYKLKLWRWEKLSCQITTKSHPASVLMCASKLDPASCLLLKRGESWWSFSCLSFDHPFQSTVISAAY